MEYVFLSEKFYNDYPITKYPEIMRKKNRPYVMVMININGFDVVLPLRSHIDHKYAFWTNKTEKKGIDFSKAIVITDGNYIDKNKKPYIKEEQHKIILGSEFEIKEGFQKYLKTYTKATKKPHAFHNEQLLKLSTLPYFDEQLKIITPDINKKDAIIKQYMSEDSSIIYIKEETAINIFLLNEIRRTPYTLKEINNLYEIKGKELEVDYSPETAKEFDEIKIIVDDMRAARLIEKQVKSLDNIKEKSHSQDILKEIS